MFLLSGISKAIERSSLIKWRGMVSRIDQLAAPLEKLSDAEVRKQSLALRYEVLSGKPLDQMMVEAYSLVREAARRNIGMKHYPVQILGGIAMHFGSIAVMQTGEGKTLTATLPIYLAALSGKGAHLATANDYLAVRDMNLMAPLYRALGLSIGVVQGSSSRSDRQKAYACDITYSTAKEIGFDFLRDRLFQRRMESDGNGLVAGMVGVSNSDGSSKPVQRGSNFMLVDEADSILIDEARTPLIVSSLPDEVALARSALYQWSSEVCDQFVEATHYELSDKSRQIHLTSEGRKLVRKLPSPPLLRQTPVMDIYEQVEQAIFIHRNYVRDRHYVVNDGEVVIVDEFTGRLAEGRKWRSGLHQGIEAREGLEISLETGESARITLQDLFLRYARLAGMTGTAANSATELRKIYNVKVVDVPTNRPPKRTHWPDLVFGSEQNKWQAIADEIETVFRTGRPVLIGTRSIDKSELLSAILSTRKIPHDVLNARQLAKEAEIVAVPETSAA